MFLIKKNKLYIVILFVLSLFLLGKNLQAAELFVKTDNLELALGQQLKIDVLINPENESINALEGELFFPTDKLKLLDVLSGDSIVNFWIEAPQLKNNSLIFSGIIPGGFEGMLRPYASAKEPGKIFSLIFQARAGGEALVGFNSARVLLNDGEGSEAPLTVNSLNLLVNEDFSGEGILVERELDYDAPEKFYPLITRDENLFDNKWFLVFYAQDKNSGIAGYFVYESVNLKAPSQISQNKWQAATSPYLLTDQELKSYVYIKAVDKAGNERVEVLSPAVVAKNYENYQNLAIIILGLIISLFVGRFLWQKIHALKK